MTADRISAEWVEKAGEAMEDAALLHLGRDLGTIHRDDIARAAIAAVVDDIRAEAWDEGYTRGMADHCDMWPSSESCDVNSHNPYRADEATNHDTTEAL